MEFKVLFISEISLLIMIDYMLSNLWMCFINESIPQSKIVNLDTMIIFIMIIYKVIFHHIKLLLKIFNKIFIDCYLKFVSNTMS